MTDKLVDLIGIGNLLESLVTEDVITCEERDQIMAKIAKENGIAEHEYKSPHILTDFRPFGAVMRASHQARPETLLAAVGAFPAGVVR